VIPLVLAALVPLPINALVALTLSGSSQVEPAPVNPEITPQEGYSPSVLSATTLVIIVQAQVPIIVPVVQQVPFFMAKNVILTAQPHNISMKAVLLASLVTLPALPVQLQAQIPV